LHELKCVIISTAELRFVPEPEQFTFKIPLVSEDYLACDGRTVPT